MEGIDDYAMMQEVLRRRFKRLAALKGKGSSENEERHNGKEPSSSREESWSIVPDLVLIDGGKGHLSAALEVFLELGIDFVPLASIAKENGVAVRPADSRAHRSARHLPGPLSRPENA